MTYDIVLARSPCENDVISKSNFIQNMLQYHIDELYLNAWIEDFIYLPGILVIFIR